MSEAGDAKTVPVLIGFDWNVEPTTQPANRDTLQEYEVPRDVLDRWRKVVSDYLRARGALLRVIEKQGFRVPTRRPDGGVYIDVVFDRMPGPEAPRFVEVEDQAGRSVRVGEWLERGDGATVLRIPAAP
jgi:hypothetical protein